MIQANLDSDLSSWFHCIYLNTRLTEISTNKKLDNDLKKGDLKKVAKVRLKMRSDLAGSHLNPVLDVSIHLVRN